METFGYVYVAQSGDLFKIGRTNHPDRRLPELAIGWRLWLSERPRIIHLIPTETPHGLERNLHRVLKKWRHGWRGEWYRLPMSVVDWLCRQSDPIEALPDFQEVPQEADRLVSLDEAAKMIGVNVVTLRRWGTEGRIAIYWLGPRTARIALSEVRRILRGA